jgi:hypothetical protein
MYYLATHLVGKLPFVYDLITLGLMYVVFFCISIRYFFQDLEHMIMLTSQQLYRCVRTPLEKGSSLHVTLACVGSKEESSVCSLSLKKCFST